MIGVLAYGIGNPSAIVNMIDYIGWDVDLVVDPKDAMKKDRLIFPGVGNFDGCARAMRERGFEDEILKFVESGRPLLGICVGAQLLGNSSEEGSEKGLGLLEMNVKKFSNAKNLPIPRISWGEVEYISSHSLTRDLFNENVQKFYFSHSYYCSPSDDLISLATTNYGINYSCIVGSKNLLGVQFHPEKSHMYGMKLFDKFAVWKP